MSDRKTRRLTASEREALVRMSVALEILHKETDTLRERTKLIPRAGFQLMGMRTALFNLMAKFAATIPDDQRRSYSITLDNTSYTIGMKCPTKLGRDEKQYGMWIPFETLRALLAGCEDHCLMCPDDVAKRRACKLRRAMEAIPNDAPPRDDGEYPFYTVM